MILANESVESRPLLAVVHDALIGPAVAFGRDVLDTEARLVSAGLWSPIELYNAAAAAGLSGKSFADADYAAIFCGLTAWAEVEGSRELDGSVLVQLTPGVAPAVWKRIEWLELSGAGIGNYAALVARYARNRKVARGLYRALCELLGDNVRAQIVATIKAHRDGAERELARGR